MRNVLFLYGFPKLKKEISPILKKLREDHHVMEDPREAEYSESFMVVAYSAGIIELLDYCGRSPDFKKRIEKIVLIAPAGMRPTNVIRHSGRFFGEVIKTARRVEVLKGLFAEMILGGGSFRRKTKRVARFDLIKETKGFFGVDIKILGNAKDILLKDALKRSDYELVLEQKGKGHFAPLEIPDYYAGIIKTM